MCYVCYVGPDCASLYQCVIYEFLEMLPNIIIHRSRNRNKKLSKRKVKRNNFWEREGLDFPSVTVFIFSRIAQWCWSSLPTTIMIFPNLKHKISQKGEIRENLNRKKGERPWVAGLRIIFLCQSCITKSFIMILAKNHCYFNQQCNHNKCPLIPGSIKKFE